MIQSAATGPSKGAYHTTAVIGTYVQANLSGAQRGRHHLGSRSPISARFGPISVYRPMPTHQATSTTTEPTHVGYDAASYIRAVTL